MKRRSFWILVLLLAAFIGCQLWFCREDPGPADRRPVERGRIEPGAGRARGATDAGPGRAVLNEILACNRRTNLDEYGKSSDWLELHNPGADPVSLRGYTLTDDPSSPGKWRFPSSVIPPGGYSLTWMSGRKGFREPGKEAAEFPDARLFQPRHIRAGETWRYLAGSPGTTGPPAGWNEVSFDDRRFAEGPSGFGYADGDDATLLPQTTSAVFLRKEFSIGDVEAIEQLVLAMRYDDGFVAYLNGTRVAAANSTMEDPDFSAQAPIKHEAVAREYFDLTPHLALLREGKNVLAIAGLNDSPSTDMSLIPELGEFPSDHPVSFRLPQEGGRLCLFSPDGSLADQVEFPEQAPDQSYGRSPDGTGGWAFFLTPTPAAPNVSRPHPAPISDSLAFSPPPGRYDEPVEVRISKQSDATRIHYTLDFSDPDGASLACDRPLRVARSTVVRAAPMVEGEKVAPAVSATYLIEPKDTVEQRGAAEPLPVFCVSMTPDDFAAVHTSGFVSGRQQERPAYLEIIDGKGQRVAATGFGLRLHGGAGRSGTLETKKSYRAYFRSSYGDGKLRCPLFQDSPAAGFDKLVLRAGYNDRLRPGRGEYNVRAAYIRDQVIRDLHGEMGCPAARGAWCLLYINLQFRGLINVVERMDEEFMASRMDGGEWDVINTGENVLSGSLQEWNALKALVRESDLSRDEDYAELERRVDIENFTAYLIVSLWSQNHDWPHNNWYAARRREEGARWLFFTWDAEWGIGLRPWGHASDSALFLLQNTGGGLIRDLFRALLQNEGYKARFLAEVQRHLAGALRSENVMNHIARQRDLVAPVMEKELSTFYQQGAYAAWERNVRLMEDFARNRAAAFEAHVKAILSQDITRITAPAVDTDEIGERLQLEDGRVIIIHEVGGQIRVEETEVIGERGDGPEGKAVPAVDLDQREEFDP